MSGFSEYGDYDALGLAELIRQGGISAAELLDEAIERAEAVNPRLNAVIHPLHDYARQQVKKSSLPTGPFAGVPFLLKDLIAAFAGAPLTNGSRFFRDFRPHHDSELVKRFKTAGLVVFGKTNTPELGLLPVTEPELFGPTHNPWDTARTPGGSSGGSGAAVAARIVPMASGGDGGGSIRIPASCCGLVGLKPSRGRNPTGPDLGDMWFGAAVEGVLSRSVRDTAAALDATAGPDAGAPHFAPPPKLPFLDEVGADPGRLRIAFTDKPLLGRYLDPECKQGLADTAKLLEDLGHHVEEATPPIDGALFAECFMVLVAGETAAELRLAESLTGRRARRRDFESGTWGMARLGRAHSSRDTGLAYRTLQKQMRQVGHFMQNYDVLLTPTLGEPPHTIGKLQPKGMDAFGLTLLNHLPVANLFRALHVMRQIGRPTFDFIPFTPIANVTGEPSISLPLHWSREGLPVGMMFTAPLAKEAVLIRLAAQLEQARPWNDRKPPVCA